MVLCEDRTPPQWSFWPKLFLVTVYASVRKRQVFERIDTHDCTLRVSLASSSAINIALPPVFSTPLPLYLP